VTVLPAQCNPFLWLFKGTILDFVVTNAAVVPTHTEVNSDGLETSFATNYFGHFYLLKRLFEENIIPLAKDGAAVSSDDLPRVVVISSESHRVAKPLSQYTVGLPAQYTLGSALNNYGYTKLLTCTLAFELARRFNGPGKQAKVNITVLCPGPVDTNIAHHAPGWMQLLFNPIKRLFFAPPLQAARRVTLLLTNPIDVNCRHCRYYHMSIEKLAREDAFDPAVGTKLWEDSERLAKKLLAR